LPADPVQEALEGILVEAHGAADEQLLDVGLGGTGLAAHRIAIDRRVTPAKQSETLFLGDALKDTFALKTAMFFHGQEAHGDAVGSRLRQLHAKLAAFAHKEGVGNLNQDACAVAGLRVATGSASMGEVDEDLEALADNLMAFFAAYAGDQSHATSIVLIP